MKFRVASQQAGKKGSRLIGGTRGVAFEFSEKKKKKALAEGGWSWLVCTRYDPPRTYTHVRVRIALAISLLYGIKKVT